MSRPSLGWQDHAACRSADPDIFSPPEVTPPALEEARLRYCRQCPVEADCLRHAITRRESGIWGGEYFDNGRPREVLPRGPVPGSPPSPVPDELPPLPANQRRSAVAAARVCRQLGHARDLLAGASLTPGQEEALRLRLEHPEATLRELAEMATPPVSKHAMNNRLRKLISRVPRVMEGVAV
jgi:WhiB family transcriptional regulator, redox-sensing transcriptional regulator